MPRLSNPTLAEQERRLAHYIRRYDLLTKEINSTDPIIDASMRRHLLNQRRYARNQIRKLNGNVS